MATLLEVEKAIKGFVVDAIYPSGTGSDPITGAGTLVKIRVGRPISEKLDIDVLSGEASQIMIFPVGNSAQNTTRFQRIWQESSKNVATLFINVNNDEITITGTVTVPQGVLVTFNNVNYWYDVLEEDTLDTIATNVAALIPGATALANVITLTGLITVIAVIVVGGVVVKELERQWEIFMISIFSPNPYFRDQMGEAIRVKIAEEIWLRFPDNTSAAIFFKGHSEQDIYEKNIIYQRDLLYRAEYSTVISQQTNEVQSIEQNIN